ncbi:helix-turn-helix transcriptional regulator [Pseudarthrobacter chlorophenolicus]|uniref:helix-turn-helix transcriptional regulator n=1 Tax=Pseudarthrobacter chlorophenolicus TaxID=85085 RepID=UPI0005F2C78D|nr:helix-turn-helix transcriptional regulator [Pseudarthrobacter chlorophenolicus]
MTELDQLLASGREAFARRDWPAAERTLREASALAPLPAGDLEALADSAWWLGDITAALANSEELYRRLLESGDRAGAAMTAIELSLRWGTRGDLAVASGWLSRARRTLFGFEALPVYGYLQYLEATMTMDFEGDPGPAAGAAEALDALANTCSDPALACFSTVLSGLALARAGDVEAGFRHLDEAMLPVLAGDVPAEWSGDIYCTVTHLCHALGDYARMRSWTDALQRWTAGMSGTFVYAHVTRVHELQLLSTEGSWEEVLKEIGPLSEALAGAHGWMAGAGYCELGDILRLRGDLPGAMDAYAKARETGVEPQPGEALLLLASGRHSEALQLLGRSLGESTALDRARLLLPATEAALAAGQRALAEAYCAELEESATRFSSPGFHAWAAHARARVLLAAGRHADALEPLERAIRIYRLQHARYSIAAVHELLADCRQGLGQQGAAAADRATALAIYRGLGAQPDVRRLDGPLPGGLTARETEVLALVSRGASNREAAAALVLSEKTVGRHLANIFAKIGVASRTAAADWARGHHVA